MCTQAVMGIIKLEKKPHWQALLEEERWEAAIELIDYKWLKELPGDASILAARAYCCYQLDNYNSALRDANAALKLDPGSIRALTVRGKIYQDRGDYQKAVADFSEAIKLDSKEIDNLFSRADCYESMHEYKKCLEDYERILAIDGKKARFYHNHGYINMKQENLQAAIEDFDQSLRYDDLEDQGRRAYRLRARSYMRLGDYDTALKDLDKALEINHRFPVDRFSVDNEESRYIYSHRGMVYLFRKNFKAAIKEFELAKEHESASDAVWDNFYLYLTYRWMGEPDKALHAIEDAKQRCQSGDWPYPLLLYLDKKLTLKEVSLLAIAPSERSELLVCNTFDKLLSGDKSGEKDLQELKDSCAQDLLAYELVVYAVKHKDFMRKIK